MLEAFLIYLYLTLGNVVVWICIFAIAYALVMFFGLFLVYLDKYADDDHKSLYRKCLYPKTFLFFLLLVCMYPSKNDLMFIVGGSVAINGLQSASEIEGIKELPENLVNAANYFLTEVTKEEK